VTRSEWTLVCGLGLIVSSCESVRWEFEQVGLDGISNVDSVNDERDGGTADGAGSSQTALDASLAFVVGPPCPDLPLACDADLDKCTVVDGEQDNSLRTACVHERGDVALNADCSRRRRGDDDCAAGGFCTPLGIGSVEEGPMICRQLCLEAEGCDDQPRCLALERGEFGLCVGECEIFADDCPGENIRCAAGADTNGSYFGYCARFGDVADGQPCVSDADCNRGAVCQQSDGTCRAMCDADHPCDAELRCIPLGLGDPQSPRVCIP
jgi:hypothetical protein